MIGVRKLHYAAALIVAGDRAAFIAGDRTVNREPSNDHLLFWASWRSANVATARMFRSYLRNPHQELATNCFAFKGTHLGLGRLPGHDTQIAKASRVVRLQQFFKAQIEECRELERQAVTADDRTFWRQAAGRWEEQLRQAQRGKF